LLRLSHRCQRHHFAAGVEHRQADDDLLLASGDELHVRSRPGASVAQLDVARSGKHISASVAEGLPDGPGGDADELPHGLLSERELQVFLRLAREKTISHMAVSMKTVSTYRTRVIDKMGLASNSDPTDDTLKNGLIQ
jgi:DNA-binding NarL/FixJ family response regulator